MNASITHRLTEQEPCKLSGDGLCNSSGYNGNYFINESENKWSSAFSITKEAGNSNRMEKLAFQKTLNEVGEKGID